MRSEYRVLSNFLSTRVTRGMCFEGRRGRIVVLHEVTVGGVLHEVTEKWRKIAVVIVKSNAFCCQ